MAIRLEFAPCCRVAIWNRPSHKQSVLLLPLVFAAALSLGIKQRRAGKWWTTSACRRTEKRIRCCVDRAGGFQFCTSPPRLFSFQTETDLK
jgi:hypothetical protein